MGSMASAGRQSSSANRGGSVAAAAAAAASNAAGWKELLDDVERSFSRSGDGDLWGNVRRQDRARWAELLDEARRLAVELPRTLPVPKVSRIIIFL
jgi:hypothetical protein